MLSAMKTPWRSNATSRTVALGVAVVMAFAAAVLRGRAPDSTVLLAAGVPPAQGPSPFTVEEATIDGLHRAIQDGRTTCEGVVRAYIERARAYNGACTTLVTKDGAPVAAASGPMRAGRPVSFPTRTRPVTDILPDFDKYAGLPLDYGRMGATASDPYVQQQYGMVAGMSDAGQVNALSTLNIRGERSVTCQAACDAPVASGPLPASCPAACDAFRQQPDALERAAELDATYGRKPDLAAMPMYCVALSFKDVFDTTDMRTTGGADVNYAMDAAPEDATIVARLRAKGAIIYAKANLDEYNAGSGDPGGAAKPAARDYGAGARSTWGGMACNPYDTERETGGSSSGSAASVAANLAACSICEETGGSLPPARVAQRRRRTRHDQGAAARTAARSAPTHIWIAPASSAARSMTRRACSTRQGCQRPAISIRAIRIRRFRLAFTPNASYRFADGHDRREAARRACASASSASTWSSTPPTIAAMSDLVNAEIKRRPARSARRDARRVGRSAVSRTIRRSRT